MAKMSILFQHKQYTKNHNFALAFEKVFIYNNTHPERWQSGNAADC